MLVALFTARPTPLLRAWTRDTDNSLLGRQNRAMMNGLLYEAIGSRYRRYLWVSRLTKVLA